MVRPARQNRAKPGENRLLMVNKVLSANLQLRCNLKPRRNLAQVTFRHKRGSRVGRGLRHSISARVKYALDVLDSRLSGLGRFGSTAALTAMAMTAAALIHGVVRSLEGEPIRWLAIVNIALEVSAVTAPIWISCRAGCRSRSSRRRPPTAPSLPSWLI